MNEVEKRNQVNQEVIEYLKSVGVEDVSIQAKALKAIHDCCFDSIEADKEDIQGNSSYVEAAGIKEGDEVYWRLTINFAPRHYQTLVGFIKRYEAIVEEELEIEMAQERSIEEAVWNHDPVSVYDDLGAPDFAVVVYSDYVEVRAYEPGVGDIIPKKNRKYIGTQEDIRWSFPLSSLDELKRLGRPVVKVEDLEGNRDE